MLWCAVLTVAEAVVSGLGGPVSGPLCKGKTCQCEVSAEQECSNGEMRGAAVQAHAQSAAPSQYTRKHGKKMS